MKNVVRVGVFLTDMANFAAMNTVYETFFEDPKPVSNLLTDMVYSDELNKKR